MSAEQIAIGALIHLDSVTMEHSYPKVRRQQRLTDRRSFLCKNHKLFKENEIS